VYSNTYIDGKLPPPVRKKGRTKTKARGGDGREVNFNFVTMGFALDKILILHSYSRGEGVIRKKVKSPCPNGYLGYS